MSKLITLSKLKTALTPLIALINKKAERPNWNENNSESVSYIENRPFYSEEKDVTIVSKSIELYEYDTGMYEGGFTSKEGLIKGNTYSVTINGINYSCVCGYNSGWDEFYLGDYYRTGAYPFCIIYYGDEYYLSYLNDETLTECEIIITGTKEVITKIPKKYVDLPEGILTTSNYLETTAGMQTGIGEVFNNYNNNTAHGYMSHAEGNETSAGGSSSHAEGYATQASGNYSHAEGYATQAAGKASHAEGYLTEANSDYSHAQGYVTVATGRSNNVIGEYNLYDEGKYIQQIDTNYRLGMNASTYYKLLDEPTFDPDTGRFTINSYTGVDKTALQEGDKFVVYANNYHSYYFEFKSFASSTASVANVLQYSAVNSITNRTNYVHVVGNGTSDTNRSNAHTLDWSGNAWFSGNVYVGGTSQDDTNAKKLATEESVNSAVTTKIEPLESSVSTLNTNVESHETRISSTETKISELEVSISSPKNGIRLIDEVNGYTYVVSMRNGELVTYIGTNHIEVTQMPNKTAYVEGEYLDTEGMVVMAYGQDGSSKEITDKIKTESVSLGDTTTTIIYIESGIIFTTTIDITVQAFDPTTILVDFDYTDNGDGTYTITGWKGTTNGVPSTEIIIPNNSKIIV